MSTIGETSPESSKSMPLTCKQTDESKDNDSDGRNNNIVDTNDTMKDADVAPSSLSCKEEEEKVDGTESPTVRNMISLKHDCILPTQGKKEEATIGNGNSSNSVSSSVNHNTKNPNSNEKQREHKKFIPSVNVEKVLSMDILDTDGDVPLDQIVAASASNVKANQNHKDKSTTTTSTIINTNNANNKKILKSSTQKEHPQSEPESPQEKSNINNINPKKKKKQNSKQRQSQKNIPVKNEPPLFPAHNLASIPSWMASKLTENSQYVCSKWDHLKLGVDVGSVALNEYLNAVQDLHPQKELKNGTPVGSRTTSFPNNSRDSNTGSGNTSHRSEHISRDSDRQSKLTPTQILHIIDTLRPQTSRPPHKSILHNLVSLKKTTKNQTSRLGDDDNSVGDNSNVKADARKKDISNSNDDSIASIDDEDDEEKEEIESDDDMSHDYDENIKVLNQPDNSYVVEGTSVSTSTALTSKQEVVNQRTTAKNHSPQKENDECNLKKTPISASKQEEVASSPSLQQQANKNNKNNLIHTNNNTKQQVKLQIPWQSLIQVYQHMCNQDTLEDGKTPLQRRKTHYMEYPDVIEKLRSLENKALELKLSNDSMKRKQQDLGIITGITPGMTMKSDERFIKKKRI